MPDHPPPTVGQPPCRHAWASLRRALLAALLVCAALPGASALAERPPNVVLLIGDDHGYPYFGFMGDDNVVTPSMDALAAGGVTFSHAHVTAPYCRPSLRTMITGLHPVQYVQREAEVLEHRRREDASYASLAGPERRIWEVTQQAMAMREFDTLPKLLGEAGYVSWQGGKWWEGSHRNGHFTEGMSDGWDLSVHGQDRFFLEMMGGAGNDLVRVTMEPVFDFIDRHRDRPFFIWFGPQLPHTPFDAPYEFTKYYRDQDLSESAKLYYSNITWWDAGVGRLLDHVESRGLLDNTLFVYLSDNGWEQDADIEYQRQDPTPLDNLQFANGGLKGKGGLFDQSFRTPIIFYWKDRIRNSFNTSSLVTSMELVPTILDLVGVGVPEGLPGYSLRPLLEGRSMPERSAIVGYTDNRHSVEDMMGQPAEGYYVRTHRWHFLWYADSDEMALYDITVDPGANHDLAGQYPDLVAGFLDRIEAWKQDMGLTGGRLAIHE